MALWTMGQPTIFFVIWEATRLSLKLKKDDSKLKVVTQQSIEDPRLSKECGGINWELERQHQLS